MWLQIVVGLVTVIGSMAMLFSPETSWNAPAAVLMGLGLGLVTPEFLMMFVKLSQHCQRGTANTYSSTCMGTWSRIGYCICVSFTSYG